MTCKRFALVLAGLVLTLVSIEAGFQFRGWLDTHLVRTTSAASPKIRALLIGDSILGLHEHDGIVAFLEVALNKLSPGTYEIVNKSQPANSSGQVEMTIDQDLVQEHPQIVVLLLGKSDFLANRPQGLESRSEKNLISPFARFKLFRFYILTIENLRTWLTRVATFASQIIARHPTSLNIESTLRELSELDVSRKYDLLWRKLLELRQSPTIEPEVSCYLTATQAKTAALIHRLDTKNYVTEAETCADHLAVRETRRRLQAVTYVWIGKAWAEIGEDSRAFHAFNQASQIDASYYQSQDEIAWLYNKRRDCRSAIPHFEAGIRLLPSVRREMNALFKCYLKEHQFSHGRDYFRSLLSDSTETSLLTWLASALDYEVSGDVPHSNAAPTDRDSYLATLWLYQKLNRQTQADMLFLRGHQFLSTRDAHLDEDSYRNIVSKILLSGANVIALQYPNEPNDLVIHALAINHDHVQFLSLRDVLVTAMPKQHILNMLDADLEHLTPLGAQIAATALAQKMKTSITTTGSR